MKKAALISVVVIMIAVFMASACLSLFAEPIVPETTAEAVSTQVQEGGVVIPKSILIGIVVGAVVLGSAGGYYYSRKRK